ncbi:hypothetical protein TNCV_4834911 [Trichonephila clavipes]|nr:hypothetical protein TNCV_4834911 [Trichonephila clavipes]
MFGDATCATKAACYCPRLELTLEEWNSIPQSLIDNLIASMANSSPPGGATSHQLLHRSVNRQVANRVAKNDANLTLSPTMLYVSVESPS